MNNITPRDFFKNNQYRIGEDGAVLTPPIYEEIRWMYCIGSGKIALLSYY